MLLYLWMRALNASHEDGHGHSGQYEEVKLDVNEAVWRTWLSIVLVPGPGVGGS